MHVFENLNKTFRYKTMKTDVKVTVEGNHDCDTETRMWHINTY